MKSGRKIISIILVITLLMQTAFGSLTPAAETVPDTPVSEQNTETEPYIIGEVEEYRTDNTKHFRMSDGTFKAVSYNAPVHVKTADGSYSEIDNSLVEDGGDFVPENGLMDIRISKNTASGQMVKIKGEYSLSWGFEGIEKAKRNGKNINKKALKLSGDEKYTTIQNATDEIRFSDVFSGVDLQYILSSDSVKENLVLKNKSAVNTFVQNFDVGKLTAKQIDSRTIGLYDGDRLVYGLSAPVMTDADGISSTDITYTVISQKGNKLRVELKADSSFLSDDDRAYPVVLDPVVTNAQSSSTMSAATLYKVNGSVSGLDLNQYFYVGELGDLQTKGLFKFKSLPTLPAGAYLVNAQVGFVAEIYTNNGDLTSTEVNLNVAEYKNSWGNETAIQYNEDLSISEIYEDYQTQQGNSYVFDITCSVRGWYANGLDNKGLLITMPSGMNFVKLYSPRHSDAGLRPSLFIQYINHTGIEEYNSYSSFDMVSGTAYVDNATGLLAAEIPILSTVSENMPAALSFYYNATKAGYHSDSVCGAGLRTNFDQRLSYVNDANIREHGYNYTYTDADGTLIYMKYTAPLTYVDEMGKGLTLTLKGNAWELKDKEGNISVFDSGGRLITIQSASSPSQIRVSYSNAKISKITDGVGNTITFERNANGAVIKIKDSYNRSITLDYVGSKLTKITNFDGSFVSLQYNAYDHLSIFNAKNGFSTSFSYGSNSKISRVTTLCKAEPSGHQGAIAYTDFAYYKDPYTKTTDHNGNYYIYNFDSAGRASSGWNEDGGSTNRFTPTTNSTDSSNQTNTYNNNKLTSENSTGRFSDNLLLNSGMESGTSWYTYKSGSGVASRNSSVPNCMLGSGSFRLSGIKSTDMAQYFQIYKPKKSGYYTYSVYYNTFSADIESTIGKGFNVLIAKVNNDGTKTYHGSSYVTGSTDGEWLRLHITTYIDASAVKEIHVINNLSADGSLYLDCAQLEYGDALGDYNIFENSSFENGLTGWSPDESYGFMSSTKVVTLNSVVNKGNKPPLFNKSVTMDHDSVGREITVNLPAKKAALSFSAYICGRGNISGAGEYGLKVTYFYSDNTQETIIKDADRYNRSWQKLSEMFIPGKNNINKRVNKIKAHVMYTLQEGSCEVTGLQLSLGSSGTLYSYDSRGNLIGSERSADTAVTSQYDSQDRLIKKTTVDKSSYEYTYSGNSKQPSTVTGPVLSNVSDDFPNPLYQKYEYTYNSYGQQTSVSHHHGGTGSQKITSSTGYSSNGKFVNYTVGESGTKTVNSYDSYDRLQSVVYDENKPNNVINYTYDSSDRLSSVWQKRGTEDSTKVTVGYSYTDHNLSGITHNGFSYSFGYNLLNQLNYVNVAGKRLITNTYSKTDYNTGNNTKNQDLLLTKSTYGNGQYVEYDYDRLQRVAGKRYNGTLLYSYGYDGNGRLATHKDVENNVTYSYYYDGMGRLKSTTGTDGSGKLYVYDDDSGYLKSSSYTYSGRTFNTNYSYHPGGLPAMTIFGGSYGNVGYGYDSLARKQDTIILTAGQLNATLKNRLSYVSNGNAGTNLVSRASIMTGTDITEDVTRQYVDYTYDSLGNITEQVSYVNPDGLGFDSASQRFYYDNLNQLTRVDDQNLNQTIVYSYDNGGNILSKRIYDYTTAQSLDGKEVKQFISYNYDATWKDLLTFYKDGRIYYDSIGNPTQYYNSASFEWAKGRQLQRVQLADGTYLSFRYNDEGVRTRKTVNGVETYFYLDGTNILAQKTGSDILWFNYDANGTRISITMPNGAVYYYAYNAQGDVIGLYSVNQYGYFVPQVYYTYDAWGKVLSITGNMADTLGQQNPFRYRGYYYDSETQFYYLNSRYYDPEVGRFINADVVDVVDGSNSNILENNLFIYCFNNPVNMTDDSGNWPSWLRKAAVVVAAAAVVITATAITVATCGAGSVAGVAMISTSITFAARTVEVAALQIKKGKKEGKSGVQITKDTFESIFNNGDKIINTTPVTKALSTTGTHTLNNYVGKIFDDKISLKTTLKSAGGKVVPYAFAAYNMIQAVTSIFSKDPTERAKQREYSLK